jgi:hypothetical protein
MVTVRRALVISWRPEFLSIGGPLAVMQCKKAGGRQIEVSVGVKFVLKMNVDRI